MNESNESSKATIAAIQQKGQEVKGKKNSAGLTLQPDGLAVLNKKLEADGFDMLAPMMRASMEGKSCKSDKISQPLIYLRQLLIDGINKPATDDVHHDFYSNILGTSRQPKNRKTE